MWPWEHLAVAYLCYSLYAHLVSGRSPTGRETAAVVLGSQVPDLVDKPLAWTFGITETGYAIGHSIFVAPFVCLGISLLAVRMNDRPIAIAFSIAYLSHLLTDVLYPWLRGGSIEPRVVLWPLASPPANDHGGLLDHFVVYFARYVNILLSDGLTTQVLLQIGLGGGIVVLWLSDGAPFVSDLWWWVSDRIQ
ncbi:metal-dependent hydrolase [Natronosalvus vescus]|uniref:metal-dependent hydrolase n=1 Tax=Natronosalvus vescus TaxID=2953881 RepID=UPI0021123AC7|nr:metal-dependent hydrolase [Natronosalvus vescus]